MKWQLPSGRALRIRKWGNESVVYDIRSGETHLLDLIATELLLALQRESSTREKLVASIAHACPLESFDEFRFQIDDVLDDLRARALVEVAQC